MIEYDKKNRPFLSVDSYGRPVVVDGHYVPCTYSDWLILTILGRETWIGLPPLTEFDSHHDAHRLALETALKPPRGV